MRREAPQASQEAVERRARRRSSPRWSTVGFAWSRRRRSAFGTTVSMTPSSTRSAPPIACRCPRRGVTSSTGTPSSMSYARWWAWAASGCVSTSCSSRAPRLDDLLFLQVKQAGPSVYEAFLEPSRYPNHGQRVTVGRRFIQSATDIFVGWTTVQGMDFYVRQFRDMKVIPSSEQVAPWLRPFASKCGRVLARAHATTGDAAAIDAYLGKGRDVQRGNGEVRGGLRAFRTSAITPSSSKRFAPARSTVRPVGDAGLGPIGPRAPQGRGRSIRAGSRTPH